MTPADMFKIAVQVKSYPQFLFKYRADNLFTEKIISDNEIFFSNPLDFNDPYDCNTPISTTSTLDEIKKWLSSVGVSQANIDSSANKLQTNPSYMKVATNNALNEIGVCCFSTMEDSILQWSHYSDYHKGICLKFDIEEDLDFFHIPLIVSYRKVMPHYNHFTQSENIAEYIIRPKFHEWAYESEIRIVKPKSLMAQNRDKRVFKYKDSALKEIIFGVKTPDSVKDKYRQLCKDHNKGQVKFSQMELDNGVHYKLNKA